MMGYGYCNKEDMEILQKPFELVGYGSSIFLEIVGNALSAALKQKISTSTNFILTHEKRF